MKNKSSSKSGFTLVEILIVIGIICVLMSLLTPAILKVLSAAQGKTRASEKDVLQAAVFEFWHDQNKWPTKNFTSKNLDDIRKKGEISFLNDNWRVFDELIGVDYGGAKGIKDYIDPGSFMTTVGASFPDGDNDDAMSLKDAIGKLRKENTLVHWYNRLKCPECDTEMDVDKSECPNEDCKRRMTANDRKQRIVRRIKPYRVTINFFSNTVSVSEY